MKKILFILPFCPWPLTSGGHQAIYNGIIAAKNYGELYITFPCEKSNNNIKSLSENKIINDIKIIPYYLSNKKWTLQNIIKKILNKISKKFIRPTAEEVFTQRVQSILPETTHYEFINQIINDYSIDIVQIEMMNNISFVLTLPETVKKIFVHHELRFIKNELYLSSLGTNLYRKALVEIEKEKELYLLNKYDRIITLSSIDKNKLIEAGVHVPISTSFATISSENNSTFKYNSSTKKLIFVGPELHTPNKIGIEWFLNNCWEELDTKGYSLYIIGNWTKKTKKTLSNKYTNIFFLGFVPNLANVLKDSIMIVPITIGSGIRMKILEAMSYKVPFVSTSIGAEGIPIENNINCFIADTPKDFIGSIIKLEDLQLINQFTNSAYKIIREHYSIKALIRNRTEIYETIQ